MKTIRRGVILNRIRKFKRQEGNTILTFLILACLVILSFLA